MSHPTYRRSTVLAAAGICLAFGFLSTVMTMGQTAPATVTATTRGARTRPTTASRPGSATRAAAPKVAAPASVAALPPTALKLFDAASASDWTEAAKQSSAYKDAMKKFRTDLPKPSADQLKRIKQITSDITAVDTAIKGKLHQPAMMSANRIIRVSGVLVDTFVNKVPQSVWQMQYLAREMQVWSAAPVDLTKLKGIPARVDTEWAIVKKDVAAKGDEALVKEFTDETTKLKSSATADDFSKLTKPLLDTLDKFEKAYMK